MLGINYRCNSEYRFNYILFIITYQCNEINMLKFLLNVNACLKKQINVNVSIRFFDNERERDGVRFLYERFKPWS